MRLHTSALDFHAVREEFGLPETYPSGAEREAAEAKDRYADARRDATDIEFVTIDPPGSMDLDQAVCIESICTGFRIRYAIADVGALVEPGSELEEESLRRGQTVYLPDGTVPLHPPVLSEGLASLLPDQTRPAVLWTVAVDAEGHTTSVEVERATVRSRYRLDYARVQEAAERGTLHPSVAALPAVGEALRRRGVADGAITLRLPAQEVVPDGDGWLLRVEPRVEADDWNAQISLLVGRAAATIMLRGREGVLRTLPMTDEKTLDRLRRTARALDLDWPRETALGKFLDGVDPNTPAGLAMMRAATSALRGADYVRVTADGPAEPGHAGIGGPYAHVTAPIRRVCDRYATEVCLALSAGIAVPEWVTDRLDAVPDLMTASDRLAGKVDRACVDLAEAVALAPRVGGGVDVVVTRAAEGERPAEAWCADPPVFADLDGPAEEGDVLSARVAEVDISARRARFEVDGRSSDGSTEGGSVRG